MCVLFNASPSTAEREIGPPLQRVRATFLKGAGVEAEKVKRRCVDPWIRCCCVLHALLMFVALVKVHRGGERGSREFFR